MIEVGIAKHSRAVDLGEEVVVDKVVVDKDNL